MKVCYATLTSFFASTYTNILEYVIKVAKTGSDAPTFFLVFGTSIKIQYILSAVFRYVKLFQNKINCRVKT